MRPGGPVDDDLGGVLWSAGSGAPEPAPALAADDAADIAVVGGGFTGLSAAIALRERLPERRLVLLEAGICGSGASGRNAGMALPGCGVDLDGLLDRLGEAGARRAIDWLGRGLARLQVLAARHAGPGAVETPGSLALALTARQARAQNRLRAIYDRLGVASEVLGPEAVRREIASPLYRGGFHVPGGAALIDPWRLVRGLRDAAIEAGAVVHERTPVLDLRQGALVALRTPGGTVRSRTAVLAVNAWAPHLGFFRNRVAPVHVACIATEPLAPAARASLGWARRQALWEEGRLYHFLRLTPDERVLIGGGGAAYVLRDGMTCARPRAAFDRLEAALRRIFPALATTRVTHRWTGPVAFARDFLPSIGTLGEHRNVHYALGYTGHGVALSHLAGEVIAALAAGDRDSLAGLFLLDRRFPTLLKDPFKWIAIHAVRNGWLALDRLGL